MPTTTEQLLDALRRALSVRLFRLGVIAALCLLLFGAIATERVAWLLVLIVAVRGLYLLLAVLRGPAPDAAHAQPAVRGRRELACEALGLVAYVLLLPLAIELQRLDLVSLRGGLGWTGAAAVVLCVALYGWPHRWAEREDRAERRARFWAVPFVPAAVLVAAGIALRHPYLDPFRADRAELAADRVLSLHDSVRAGMHADWVFDWAATLAARGEWQRALGYYRGGLRLAPNDAEAHASLRALEERLGAKPARGRPADPRPQAHSLSPWAFARLPFWTDGQRLARPRACRLDASLAEIAESTAVIVPVGAVPAAITDAVGDVLVRETGLSVCLAEPPLELPAPTRFRGLVFGRQWSVESLVQAASSRIASIPRSPIRLLLVTGADIYSGDANFVYSSSRDWGAVLSYARLRSDERLLQNRVAKQALGALVKSFGVGPSPDPDCVTSYSNGPEQFDAKGNRPNTESFLRFRRRVDAENRAWAATRALIQ